MGMIVCAAIVLSGQAMAESISSIGKTIDAEYAVVVDGKTLDVKAIGVDGVSTTPNRALGNAVGYKVEFKEDTVYFTKQEIALETEVEEVPETSPDPVVEFTPDPDAIPESLVAPEKTFTLENIDEAIKMQEGSVKAATVLSKQFLGVDPSEDAKWTEHIVKLQKEVDRLKSIKAELEAQK